MYTSNANRPVPAHVVTAGDFRVGTACVWTKAKLLPPKRGKANSMENAVLNSMYHAVLYSMYHAVLYSMENAAL